MCFTLLTHMSNFVPIRCYLKYDLKTYFLCIILDYNNLQFKQLIDDIVNNLWSFRNFASMENITRKCNPIVDLSVFAFNKKI